MASTPILRNLQLSDELPDWLRFAICDAVVLFGRIEQELIEVRWVLTAAGLKERLKLARSPSTENFVAMLDDIEQLAPELELDALRRGFVKIANDRNLIVHGSWHMANGKPWVVWHKLLEDTDSIIGEYFEASRFERFEAMGREIYRALRTFHTALEKQTGTTTTAIPRSP